MNGIVHGSGGGVYRVCLDSGQILESSIRGRLKKEARTGDRVVIGDRVEVETAEDGSSTIEVVHPRRSEVVRKGPGGRKPKVIAANLDRLVVVAACARPEPGQFLLDRLLVIGEANRLEPALVMNKCDLLDKGAVDGLADGPVDQGTSDVRAPHKPLSARDLCNLYRRIGYQVLETSVVTGEGLESVRGLLCSGTSALVGPSGAGKSSLLNAIQPGLGLRIGELSQKKGRGRHTTVSGRLIPLECGGLVADTPGFSDAGVWGVEQRELEGCFPEFHPFRDECQFRGCTHLHEPNCGVQAALASNQIEKGRFDSYRGLVQEAEGP